MKQKKFKKKKKKGGVGGGGDETLAHVSHCSIKMLVFPAFRMFVPDWYTQNITLKYKKDKETTTKKTIAKTTKKTEK